MIPFSRVRTSLPRYTVSNLFRTHPRLVSSSRLHNRSSTVAEFAEPEVDGPANQLPGYLSGSPKKPGIGFGVAAAGAIAALCGVAYAFYGFPGSPSRDEATVSPLVPSSEAAAAAVPHVLPASRTFALPAAASHQPQHRQANAPLSSSGATSSFPDSAPSSSGIDEPEAAQEPAPTSSGDVAAAAAALPEAVEIEERHEPPAAAAAESAAAVAAASSDAPPAAAGDSTETLAEAGDTGSSIGDRAAASDGAVADDETTAERSSLSTAPAGSAPAPAADQLLLHGEHDSDAPSSPGAADVATAVGPAGPEEAGATSHDHKPLPPPLTEEEGRVASELHLMEQLFLEREKELQAAAAERADEFERRLAEISSRLETELAERLQVHEARLHAEASSRLAEARAADRVELRKRLEQARDHTMRLFREKATQRLEALARLRSDVQAQDALFKQFTRQDSRHRDMHRAACLLSSLEAATERRRPFATQLNALRQAVGPQADGAYDGYARDPLLQAALAAVPDSVAERGLLTADQLAEQLALVAVDGRRRMSLAGAAAAAAPAAAATGTSILERLKSVWLSRGSTPGDVFDRAHYHLEHKDLNSAVVELEGQLQEEARLVADPWLQAARDRLGVEQAIGVVRAQLHLARHQAAAAADT